MGQRNNDKYFATLVGEEYLDELKLRINEYRDFCGSSGLAARWSVSMGAYFGVGEDGKTSWRITPGGEMGELVQMKVADYPSLLRHQRILATQQRPAGIAKAVNMDVSTLRNARIGTQLVEYYLTDPSHNFESQYLDALDLTLASAEAFVVQDWDTSVGEFLRPDDEGQEIKDGDLVQEVVSTWNAARDIGSPNPLQPWYIFSKRVNKFDLAAKFPAYADEIINFTNYDHSGVKRPVLFPVVTEYTDFIELHKLVHLPTPACPEGRYTIFIPECILLDNAYPYPSKCFHRVSGGELIETAFGHTQNYDLLSLEQVTDALHSIVLNNQTTFGVSTIVGPKGGGIAHQELAKGLRYLELDPNLVDKVRPLNLTATPVEIFNYIQALGQKKGELSGINSILRGDPEGSLKGASGSAMALLQSQAIQFNSAIQQSYYRLLSSAGTGIIELLRKFAQEPRIVRIAGKANAEAIKEYKYDSQTLGSVSTVVFEPVNAVLQTAAGKLSIADSLLERGMITSPAQYIEVMTTGNLQVILDPIVTIQEAILEENEFLIDGKPVSAVIVENHQKHIEGHYTIISKPNAKADLDLVQRVLMHIQEHTNLWTQASMQNPAILAATGQQVLPVNPGMMPPGGAPPPPENGPPVMPPGPSSAKADDQPKLPEPPTNPATGEKAPVQPGTSVR